MGLLDLTRVNAHVVQVALGRRHVLGLIAPLQSKKLVAQCGFHVDCGCISGPRGHCGARVEHVLRIVYGKGCERHGGCLALVQYGHDGVLGHHRARAHLGLQRGGRNVAVAHSPAEFFGALLLTQCHTTGHSVEWLGHWKFVQ